MPPGGAAPERVAGGGQGPRVVGQAALGGDALRALGRFDEAADAMRDALGIYERLFGPDDVYVAFMLEILAGLALDCRNHPCADATFRPAALTGAAGMLH